jgi:hypothetical protein
VRAEGTQCCPKEQQGEQGIAQALGKVGGTEESLSKHIVLHSLTVAGLVVE